MSPRHSADGLMYAFKRRKRDFSSAAAVTELGWMHKGGGEAVDVGDQALMRGLDTALPSVRPRRSLSYFGRRRCWPQSIRRGFLCRRFAPTLGRRGRSIFRWAAG